MPLLFLNVGEMSKYKGLARDTISGGGKNVSLYGFGHEIFNFEPYKRKMYGFGKTPHNAIRLENLGATKDAENVNGVTVIWVAKSRIVGWYKNATVYRHHQQPPRNLAAHTKPIRSATTSPRENRIAQGFHVTLGGYESPEQESASMRWDGIYGMPMAQAMLHLGKRCTSI